MTELQLKKDLANITDAELIEQAKNMICKLAETSGRSLQMSVPPNKRDTDMLLMELVNRYDNVVNNLLISGVVSSKKPYYMLVNKNGNPITTDSKLPIFWLKKIAKKEAVKFNADIKKIYL